MRRRGPGSSWFGAMAVLVLACGTAPGIECERGTTRPRGPDPGAGDDCNGNLNPDACDVAPVNFGFVGRSRVGSKLSGTIVAGDLDSDGDLDLAGDVSWPPSPAVLKNRGDGSFLEPEPIPLMERLFAAADMDGDEDVDLVGKRRSPAAIAVFTHDGRGAFSAGTGLSGVNGAVHRVKALDLDGDERVDLALTLGWPMGISFWNLAAFSWPIASITGTGMESLILEEAADFDADGDPDLVVSRAIGATLQRNDGQFTFKAVETLPFAFPQALAPADLDGDGDIDLGVSRPSSVEVIVLLNEGGGSFGHGISLSAGTQVLSLAAGDLDGDGLQDLAAAGADVVAYYLSEEAGSFSGRSVVPPGRASAEWIVPADFDGDGDNDLALPSSSSASISLLENRPVALSLDCNANGVPDECEPGIWSPACEDCDANGIPDVREIADGTHADLDRNGVPDSCEDGVEFRLRFRGPGTVAGSPGTVVRFPQAVEIQTLGLGAGQAGAQGWVVTVTAEGARLVGATTAGTAAAPAPEGYRVEGFERTGFVAGDGCEGVVSAVALNITGQDVTLDPAAGPLDILHLTVEAEIPSEDRGGCRLDIESCPGRIQDLPGEGAGGDHDVPSPLVTYDGVSYDSRLFSRTVHLVPARFLRGDVNGDGRVDISDAIRAFMFLFLGAAEPPCLDGADSNDDGAVNMTDGIHILNDFFREGTGIPAPGPFECGLDPTRDELGCNGSVHCI